MQKELKTALLYSGGYESFYGAIRFPRAKKIFLRYSNASMELVKEMEKRGCIIVPTNMVPSYMTIQGILVAKALKFDEVITGCEDDRDFRYIDDVLWAENNPDSLNRIERNIGIKITNSCDNLTHADIIKKVLSVARKEDIITCNEWDPKRTRCGKCYKCLEEDKVISSM